MLLYPAYGASLRRWTPLALGAKLKIWSQPSSLAPGTWLDTILTMGTGGYGIADFAGSGSTRPYLDTSPMTSRWCPHYDGSNDFVASTSTVNDIIDTADGDKYHRIMVVQPEIVAGAQAVNAYLNCGIVSDAAGWLGTFLRDMGAGQYQVQGFQYDGASKVAAPAVTLDVGRGPIVIDQWYDGVNLHCAVYYNGVWTTATVASGAIAGSATLRMAVSSAGAMFFGGMIYEVICCVGNLTGAEQTDLREFCIAGWSANTPAIRYQATVAKAWGNLEAGGTLPLAPAKSPTAMQVFDTDAAVLDVRAYQNTVALANTYALGGIMRGAAGVTAPDTECVAIGPVAGAVTYRTGPISVGGAGTRRVFLIDGPKTGAVGTAVSEAWLPVSATTAHVTQAALPRIVLFTDSIGNGSSDPADYNAMRGLPTLLRQALVGTHVIYIDGTGGSSLAFDGYSATAGVIDGGAALALRNAWKAKIAALGLGAADYVIMMRGTNDMAAGELASDVEVAVDQWVTDAIASVAGSTILLQTIIRRLAYEGTTAPGYRTAVEDVGTARAVGVINGLAVYTAADLGADGIHPLISKEGQHVAALVAAL